MSTSLIIILVVIGVLLILFFWSATIVPQSNAYVIERLGKYKTTLTAGFHMRIPIFDNIVRKVSLKEQVLDFPPQSVITKDNVTISIDSVVFAKVFDPRLFTYGIENAMDGLRNLSATTLRNIIGEIELDQTLTSRDEINRKLEVILDEATDPWGLKVTRVEIKDIKPPESIEEVMTKQMRAERERRQTVLEAQAHQESVVARAEGDKKAKILSAEAERDAQIALAEGRSKSIRMVYQAEADGLKSLKEAQMDENVLRLKSLEALKDVSNGRATKIYMPSDLTQLVTTLGVAGESLGIGDATAIDKSPKPDRVSPLNDPCLNPETSREGVNAAITGAAIERDVSKDQPAQ